MSTTLQTSTRPFLTARWQHLILINYAVDPAILVPHLPPGLSLDMLDGQPHVSLVAFDFLDTRVLGIPWPGYRNFPEINLRFYVRDGDRRGVAFIREYVPRRMIAWIAQWLYNEPYHYAPMTSRVTNEPSQLEVEHRIWTQGTENRIRVVATQSQTTPLEGSEAHFFKEHSWGYGTGRDGKRITYEVSHPIWSTYAVRDLQMDWDWEAVYGPAWAHLAKVQPRSVYLAHGSEVAVSPRNPKHQ